MRLGIVTPVLTMLPRGHATWEQDGSWADVVAVAQAADRLGYDHLTCSEHVAVPVDAAETRGGRYYDPLATLGYLAAVTQHIGLATYVLVLGYHHPLEVAKRYGTLDVVSGGRLVLGVGVGSLEEEFDLLGASFADRGARADEALAALRAAWGEARPAFAGEFYAFGEMVVEPTSPRPRVPIWVGGRTGRSLRRAVALGDAWAPFGLSPAEVAAMLARVDRPAAFDVVLQTMTALDPLGQPDSAVEAISALREAGATAATLRFVHHSPAHYIEQLEAAVGLAT